MGQTFLTELREDRFRLQNPYAHIEYLLEKTELVNRAATETEILKDRSSMQDPYAHLNENGGYSAIIRDSSVDSDASLITKGKNKSFSDNEIEHVATQILRSLWKKAQESGQNFPEDPVAIIDPISALQIYGFDVSYEEDLGLIDEGKAKVAGILDDSTKTVRISNQFPIEVRLFTVAHELGHVNLHDINGQMHRDRALNGETLAKDELEREADKFATYFLMPEKLVLRRFRESFGADFLSLNENTAFALQSLSLSEMKKQCRSLRDFSKVIAGTGKCFDRHFPSLASQFRVSTLAMAIRLEELDLVEFPTV